MPMFRVAISTDAGELASLAEQTFRDSFESQSSLADINSHCSRHFTEAMLLTEILDTNYLTFVVEDSSQLIAFAQIRLYSPQEHVAGNRPSELHRIYVLSDWHGKGIAQDIMSVLLKPGILKEADTLWLSVWEKNPRAITFYRKYGFNVVGEQIFQVGSDPQRDLILSMNLN